MSNPTPSTPFSLPIVGPPNLANGDSGAGGQNDYAKWWDMRPYLRRMIQTDYNPLFYGSTMDDVSINAAILDAGLAGAGVVHIPAGVWTLNAPINAASANLMLLGDGQNVTWLKPSATFVGANIINITANFVTVQGLAIAYSSNIGAGSAGNPTADGIQITGAQYVHLLELEIRGVNGWAIQSTSTAGVANQGGFMRGIHLLHTASGIHLLGNAGSGFNMGADIGHVNAEIVDTGDCLLIEDCNDALIINFGGAAGQGAATNSAIHIKGACSSISVVNPDVGVFPGPASAPTMLVESGPNGTPTRVGVFGGVLQAGTYCFQATAGSNIVLSGVEIRAFTLIGVSLEFAGAMYGIISDCIFANANTGAGAGRFNIRVSSGSARVMIQGCTFRDTIGAGVGQVNQSISTGSGRCYILGNYFEGATTLANAVVGSPNLFAENPQVNPVGSITVSVTASPFTIPAKPHYANYYITGGTVSSIVLDGVTTGLVAGAFHVPPQKTIVVTYTVAPTITGYGE